MNRNWAQNSATPGSVKPVYGAQYPPLRQTPVDVSANEQSSSLSKNDEQGTGKRNNFQKYEESVSDAWDLEDVQLDSAAASASAAKVLAHHAAQRLDPKSDVMPNVHPIPSKNSRVQAMQRLATQRAEPAELTGCGAELDNGDITLVVSPPPIDPRPPLKVAVVGENEHDNYGYVGAACSDCALTEPLRRICGLGVWTSNGSMGHETPMAVSPEPIPGTAMPASGGQQPALYPRLPDLGSAGSNDQRSTNSNTAGRTSPSPQRTSFRGRRLGSLQQRPDTASPKTGVDSSRFSRSAGSGDLIPSSTSAGTGREKDLVRFDRLRLMLGTAGSQPGEAEQQDIDLDQLRKDCWMGVPHMLRPQAWRLLSGYLPTNAERREATMTRKREEYWHYVEQYFHTRHEEQYQDTFRQIHIDIPRMCPLIPLFQQKMVQEIFERILYIWAIRHPASGYVQGINDLVTPFFVVFLSEFVRDDTEVGTFDVSQLPREHLEIVEADSFWCVSALLDTIQDNYTFAQPGIQRKVLQLRHLVSRVDNQLHQHLEAHSVEYLQFAFRWMNNLLMREIPLRATIRLWDTYLSERNGFSQFHGYVCAAFLRMWSKQLQQEKEFQSIMILLQNLPTQHWSDQHICELTADAYSLMALFAGAKNHLQATPSVS
uniref:Rab-GAP TBC domain-containing protein n=2 Tax=Plectus sambesii TaxID=2011161 RepID=A0A914WUY4_9BILA